jgi:excinuclease UvrABC nuclease subunit
MPKLYHRNENKIMSWKRDNVLKDDVPNYPGIYYFYGPQGQLLYTGHAHKMRHRLQSYYQQDCFRTHPSKQTLRSHIKYFRYDLMPVVKARAKERLTKKHALFNFR